MHSRDRKDFDAVMHDAHEAIGQGERYTPGALDLMFASLMDLTLPQIQQALINQINDSKAGKWRPNAASIRDQIERRAAVAWLSADEAWSQVPKIEGQPGLLNNITAQALAVANQFLVLERPDMTAARMAFKGCYDRLVERAKLERRGPVYFVSPGGSFEDQQAVVDEGVRQGLLAAPAAAPVLLIEQGKRTPGVKPDLKALLLTMQAKTMPPPEAQDYE